MHKKLKFQSALYQIVRTIFALKDTARMIKGQAHNAFGTVEKVKDQGSSQQEYQSVYDTFNSISKFIIQYILYIIIY